MNFFDHKNLGNHLLQLCPKVVKHPYFNTEKDENRKKTSEGQFALSNITQDETKF